MSLLKTNEIQNYNGSSLTLTASTVSTSAQLNTGGNISVTGSLNVSDDSTTRTNLGLGTIATQDSDSITVTGGSVTGTEIDLKSSGTTIYKSDGTTAILSESGGLVTMNNVTLDGDVAIASSGLTVRNIEQVALVSDQALSNDASLTTFFSPTYTPKFSGSKVMGCLNGIFYLRAEARDDGRKTFVLSFTGSDITDIDYGANQTIGGYDFGSSGILITYNFTTIGPLLTTTGTSTITCNCKLQNDASSPDSSWLVYGNNTLAKTFFTWIEYK